MKMKKWENLRKKNVVSYFFAHVKWSDRKCLNIHYLCACVCVCAYACVCAWALPLEYMHEREYERVRACLCVSTWIHVVCQVITIAFGETGLIWRDIVPWRLCALCVCLRVRSSQLHLRSTPKSEPARSCACICHLFCRSPFIFFFWALVCVHTC